MEIHPYILRIDGAYIKQEEWQYAKSDDYVVVYLFYANSTVFRALEKKREFEGDFNRGVQELVERHRGIQTSWGRVNVVDKMIKCEFWEPSSGGGMKTSISSGTILNDSTLLITSLFDNYTGKSRQVNVTLDFNFLSQKPDSTNNFIK